MCARRTDKAELEKCVVVLTVQPLRVVVVGICSVLGFAVMCTGEGDVTGFSVMTKIEPTSVICGVLDDLGISVI